LSCDTRTGLSVMGVLLMLALMAIPLSEAQYALD
jgi:hypothetical protein